MNGFKIWTLQDLLYMLPAKCLQQNSRITRCILQTFISKPLPSSFEILEQSNATTKACTKDITQPSTIIAKINIPRNIPLKWSSMKLSCPRREYHTWKISRIKNDIKCDDSFASNTQAMQRVQNKHYGLVRFDGLTSFKNSRNQGFQNLPSSVPRRDFFSKSCIVIQNSIQKNEISRKDLFSADLSIIRLRNRVSLTKLQSFFCDASKKFSDKSDGYKSQQRSERDVKNEDCDSHSRKVSKKPQCQDEGKEYEKEKCSRRKDACNRDNRVSSRDIATCEKQRDSESESCKHYICPELRVRQCIWEQKPYPGDEACRSCHEDEESVRDYAQSKKDCSQKQDIDATKCSQRRRSKLCTRRNDCEKSSRKNSSKKKDCRESKSDEKRYVKCSGSNQKRYRKRNSSRNSDKMDGKRHYSQQSIFSVSRNHRSFSLIPDIVHKTDVRKTTKSLFSWSKNKKKDKKQSLSCKKQKRKCKTAKKDETKKRCVKGPAKCLSRKSSTVDKMQTCQSTLKDKNAKLHEFTKKSCNHMEYCANRKLDFNSTKDKKPTEKLAKEQPSITKIDKKPEEISMKERIDREYKEIDECKKYVIKEIKNEKTTSTEYKPTGLDRVISPCKQKVKDSKKFTSISNEPIFSNSVDTSYNMLNIQSSIINDEIPIMPKNIKLLNTMFDRSFSTIKVSYQDDFTIKRTAGHSKMVQNCSANNSDFIHGDELPNYIEIENDKKEDEYD